AVTLEEVTQEVIQHVCTRTRFIVGHAYIASADSGDLVPTRVWCRAERERFETFRAASESVRLEPGVGVPGRVLASGEAIWISEVSGHPDFTRARAAADCGLHTAAAIPVLVGEEIVAVLEFFAEVPLPPDQMLLEALTDVGTQIGRVVERVRSEAAHIAARGLAEIANSAKSEFLSRMSHELRTPMNAILGFAQLLELDHLSPDQQESVDQILKGGRHLLALINEVLDISRIEAGRMPLSQEPVQVREVLEEVLGLVWPLARDRHIALPKTLPELSGRYVRADRQRLKQVLLNLFSNAIKYNRQRGSVEISCTGSGDRLRISVTDTGPGIPADKRAQLFHPFERLGAEQNGLEGTGLGLALSKALIEAMQGEIGVETEPGQGSTFWVELPTAEAELERYELEGSTIPATDTSPAATARTVLYIEDNLSNLRLVERVLATQPEINVIPAGHGRLGLELAAEHAPDLILLDVNLPDLQGEEVLLRLQADARTAGTPVIILSADATPGQVQRFLMTGARAYLTKPIDVKQFLQLTNEVLSTAGVEG
ncbi:MAG: response regulator, partial [Gemmatimonadetes bacterium]|nr:response regulator [Gemmatimonadota bacterium]